MRILNWIRTNVSDPTVKVSRLIQTNCLEMKGVEL